MVRIVIWIATVSVIKNVTVKAGALVTPYAYEKLRKERYV